MNRIHRSAGLRSSTTLLQATTAEERRGEAAAAAAGSDGGAVRRYCPPVDEVDGDNLHMSGKFHLQQQIYSLHMVRPVLVGTSSLLSLLIFEH